MVVDGDKALNFDLNFEYRRFETHFRFGLRRYHRTVHVQYRGQCAYSVVFSNGFLTCTGRPCSVRMPPSTTTHSVVSLAVEWFSTGFVRYGMRKERREEELNPDSAHSSRDGAARLGHENSLKSTTTKGFFC